MAFTPREHSPGSHPILEDVSGESWSPVCWHQCSFPRKIFFEVMMNLIKNPNINSKRLFRADILLETTAPTTFEGPSVPPRIATFKAFDLNTLMVRRLIPRNILLDKPLDQTCLLYTNTKDTEDKSLVVYLPHISSPSESPFYHPAVRGIAFLHTFNFQDNEGTIQILYSFFTSEPQSTSLVRTAGHLLHTVHKHGQGLASGYVKRVHHDTILPQVTVQNTYARLKAKYAKSLISSWAEVTDPIKHVFEDLGIAAFLVELWTDMYSSQIKFPGFVDIGCGNGLLVHILTMEGYLGWGFDARRRKSWETYMLESNADLKELVLIPSMIQSRAIKTENMTTDQATQRTKSATNEGEQSETNQDNAKSPTREYDPNNQSPPRPEIYDGIFPKGTFIISNHADELTPWTPVLATISESPFIVIPCCSHNLSGSRFRAPAPKAPTASNSSYSSLVAWVSKLAEDCGWEVEKEMLRIPSTRNTALLGRRRVMDNPEINFPKLIEKYGGSKGWEENAMRLAKGGPRGH